MTKLTNEERSEFMKKAHKIAKKVTNFKEEYRKNVTTVYKLLLALRNGDIDKFRENDDYDLKVEVLVDSYAQGYINEDFLDNLTVHYCDDKRLHMLLEKCEDPFGVILSEANYRVFLKTDDYGVSPFCGKDRGEIFKIVEEVFEI